MDCHEARYGCQLFSLNDASIDAPDFTSKHGCMVYSCGSSWLVVEEESIVKN
jgi:hypothetical protein